MLNGKPEVGIFILGILYVWPYGAKTWEIPRVSFRAAGLKKKWENDNDYWDTWDKRQAWGATKPAACEIGRAASGFGFAAFVALGSPCGESPTTQGHTPCVVGYRL